MIFVDCFSLEFLLSAGNLFDKDIAYNDVANLSDTVSKLYLDGKVKQASIMVIVLLKLLFLGKMDWEMDKENRFVNYQILIKWMKFSLLNVFNCIKETKL